MCGNHYIKASNRYCKYFIELNRNVTILTGDSGTGKSSFYNLIREYRINHGTVNTTFESDITVRFGPDELEDFESIESDSKNRLFIFDEDLRYIYTEEFASIVNKSDNYYLIISRNPLPNIPYSYKSVLMFRTIKDKGYFETQAEEIMSESIMKYPISQVLTEDSKSGRSVFKRVSTVTVRDVNGEPEGKTSLYSKAKSLLDDSQYCLVIADGAAIGSEFLKLLQLSKERPCEITFWLPESFEWLLLKSGIVWRRGVQQILDNPSKFIDSKEFVSWERFFTWMVTEIMKNTNHPYSKSQLNEWYLSEDNIRKLKKVIPTSVLRLMGSML